MMSRLLATIGLSIVVLCAAGCSTRQAATTLARETADLDNDGVIERVSITSTTKTKVGQPMGGEIVVSQTRGSKSRVVWRQPRLNPWKLQIADVDGDKQREVVVGVYKKSPRDPVMAKRVFVYTWNGKRLMPKWLGSRLSRRFDDFQLLDINNDGWDELAALEVAPKDKRRIALYRWRSFGFDWLGCSRDSDSKRIFLPDRDGAVHLFIDGSGSVTHARDRVRVR